MTPDLATAFAEQRSTAIDWNGVRVHSLVQFDEVPSGMTLTFVSGKTDPVQGVELRMRGGTLLVNGHESADIVLWWDTAPPEVRVEVRTYGRQPPVLKLWNIWRGSRDVTQAWLGNAGIRIEGDPASGRFCIRCSDGLGEPSFDDLVVDIETE